MAEWFRHKRHGFYILWSIGILSLGAFQLPFLLANAGARFTLTTFNVFYAITAPLSFLGLLLIYAGLLPISSFKGHPILASRICSAGTGTLPQLL